MNKNQEVLWMIAVIFSLLLCSVLIISNYEYFGVIYNSGKNYLAFASRSLLYVLRGLAYIGLNIVYVVWLIQNRQKTKVYRFTDILKYASIFLLIAFIAQPLTSDIYLYLHYGLMDLNGVNPFINAADKFTSELSPILRWSQSSTYGPVSLLFFKIAAVVIPHSIIISVYLFKLFCLLLHIFNAYFIWRQLKSLPHQTLITQAYLVNPILLFEQVSNAHVDILVCTALIILIISLKHRYYVLSILSILLGFLAKTLPIIWLPLVSVFLVRQQRWQRLLIAIFLSLAIVAALCFTALPTFDAWKSLLNPGIEGRVAGSLHFVLTEAIDKYQRFLPNQVTQSKNIILSAFKLLTYSGFAAYYSWTMFKAYFKKSYSETNLILDIGWTTLVLFLFATPWYQPWYPSVLLPITALNTNSRHFVITSLTFCIFSACSFYTLTFGPSVAGVVGSLLVIIPTIVVFMQPKLLRSIPYLKTE